MNKLKPSIFAFFRLKFPEFCSFEAKPQTFLVFPKPTPSFVLLVKIYVGPQSKEKKNIFSEKGELWQNNIDEYSHTRFLKKGVVSYFLKQLTLKARFLYHFCFIVSLMVLYSHLQF